MFQSTTVDPLRVFRELENLYRGVVATILKPSVLRTQDDGILTLDIQNMVYIFLDEEQADLGDTFLKRLKESRLPKAEQCTIKARCLSYPKALACELQRRLPHSTSILRRIEILKPQKVLRVDGSNGLLHLPLRLFGCPAHELETEVRQLGALQPQEEEDCLQFWGRARNYKDAAVSAK